MAIRSTLRCSLFDEDSEVTDPPSDFAVDRKTLDHLPRSRMPNTMPTSCTEAKRETSPFPKLFGRQASRIAALFRIAPNLAARLSLAPARALHSVAAFLEAEAAQGTSLETMTAALSSSTPRALLAHALPGHDPRLFRLLDRATLPTWSLADVRALDEVVRADLADLLGGGSIKPEGVRSARSVLDAHPILRRVCRAIPDSWTRDQLAMVLDWLEDMSALHHLAGTPPDAGLNAIARRLRLDLRSLRAPPAPFEIPEGWHQVGDIEELWAVGRKLENCIALSRYGSGERVADLMSGRDVYLFNASSNALFQLRHMGGHTWACVESGGRRNRLLGQEIERGLADGLRRSGVFYLKDDLGSALGALLRPLRARPDLDDAEDEDGREEAQEAA
jgi:hypothetical protein